MNLSLIFLIGLASMSLTSAQYASFPFKQKSSGISKYDLYIGGSFGSGSDGEASFTGLNSDYDLQGDRLYSLEFGGKNMIDRKSYFALSAELLGTESEFSSPNGEIEAQTIGLLANLRYGYEVGAGFTIYISGGIGAFYSDVEGVNTTATTQSATNSSLSAQEVVFGYQYSIGLEYEVTSSLSFYTQYRWVKSSDFDEGDFSGTPIDDRFIDFGARFYF